MKNELVLDALEVQELSREETTKIDGGLGFGGTLAAALIVAVAVEVMNDWNNFKRGFLGEPEKPRGT